MLINFSLQMRRKYTNQLRVHKPKGTALLACWGGGCDYFGGLGLSLLLFSRGGVAPALSGKGNLIPTAALYTLFTTSFPAFPPGPSDFLWRPAVRAARDAPPATPSLHPGWGLRLSLQQGTSPERCSPADVLGEGRADRTSRIRLLRSIARGKQPKHHSRSIWEKQLNRH